MLHKESFAIILQLVFSHGTLAIGTGGSERASGLREGVLEIRRRYRGAEIGAFSLRFLLRNIASKRGTRSLPGRACGEAMAEGFGKRFGGARRGELAGKGLGKKVGIKVRIPRERIVPRKAIR